MKTPDRAGPRGWYQSKAGAWWFWTGLVSASPPQGLCIRLSSRAVNNAAGRAVFIEKHWLNSIVVRRITSSGAKQVPAELNGLPTADAVKAAEGGAE